MRGGEEQQRHPGPEQEAEFRRAYDPLEIGVALINLRGEVVFANESLSHMLCYSRSELEGKRIGALTPWSWLSASEREAQNSLFAGGIDRLRATRKLRRSDGSQLSALFAATLRFHDGQASHVLATVLDIERESAKEEMGRDDQRFRTLVECSPDAIFLVGPCGTLTFANKAACELFGDESKGLAGIEFSTLWPRESMELDRKRFDRVLGEGCRFQVLRLRRIDGEVLDVCLSAVVLHDAAVFFSCRDVSADLQAQEKLQLSEERLRLVLRGTQEAPWDFDLSTDQLYYSPQWWAQLGYEPNALPSDSNLWARLMHPDDQERVTTFLAELLLSDRDSYELELRLQHRNGHFVPVLSRGFVVRNENGRPTRVTGTNRDLTSSKEAESQLRAERDRAQAYLDIAAVMLISLDRNGRITLANQAAADLLGWEPKDLVGQEWFRFIPETGKERVRELLHGILREEVDVGGRVEGPVLTIDGRQRDIAWRNALIRDPDGQISGTLSSGEDITELKALQAQLAQADRLSTMGVLAGGVAHEINNPLSYLLINLESLMEDLPSLLRALRSIPSSATPPKLRRAIAPDALEDILERFEDALEGARRIGEVAGSLSAFSRVERDEAVPVSLPPAVDSAIKMARNQIRYRARLVVDHASWTPPVVATYGRLSQVVLNLLINAVHAIDEGDLDANEIRVRTWAEGDEVCVSVTDTGCGISEEHRERLFEPFFTTKEIGVGSGLGLSISQSIVESFAGRIHFESEFGRGSCFTVRLPAAPSAPDEPRPEYELPTSSRILVIDDEAPVREALLRMLRNYQTVGASSGESAKRILLDDADFDYIICDVMMPSISGLDLYSWLVDEYPQLAERVIFITGGAITPTIRQKVEATGKVTLEKPFCLERLLKTLASAPQTGRTSGRSGS